MIVIVLTSCPPGLRGHLTQWLLEISAGVYIGHVNARIRERLWARVIEMAGPGRALMVFQEKSEQRLSFAVHDHHWEPVDLDGVTLIRRAGDSPFNPALPSGWSKAAKRRRFGRRGTQRGPTSPTQSEQKPGS
ncbi:type I-E CRISPR-associated endoribonuclease Cas2 [Actinoplanes sp. LDG1-06]|uniref:Type I-E CRISPR-associated endoribonuclease Cas2 n=1 Tax=Paractinoplanes ovalisporus TaxID=2810368 RepID=A0ABS2ASX0_9ACTN|nr:type I-E CRISPR-associated endoribonuclease Cas2e [Actinoplanes ovalisporus]MBM2622929.1 type I-E CRISPR-associated endoribonuclease Cas2 [Actinoplanes ovalisporus]